MMNEEIIESITCKVNQSIKDNLIYITTPPHILNIVKCTQNDKDIKFNKIKDSVYEIYIDSNKDFTIFYTTNNSYIYNELVNIFNNS